MKTETYIAVYQAGASLPRCLFLRPEDAAEWHDNPGLFSNCRRRVVISPAGDPKAVETEAVRLLRELAQGDPDQVTQQLQAANDFLASLEGGKRA